MRISLISIFKPIALSIAAIAVFGLGQGVVKADEVFIAGSTDGCFGALCVPGNTSTVNGLTYHDSIFFGTTVNGVRALGGNAGIIPGTNFNNLGSMTLLDTANLYNTTFTLQVTFSAPEGIAPSNQATFVATVTGAVTVLGNGGVIINFDNAPLLFTFNDTNCGPTTVPGQQTTCGSGSFMFSVNDLAIDPGQTASVTGQIFSAQQTTIPEPTSMLLLGTGLAGIAGAVRRRLRARN